MHLLVRSWTMTSPHLLVREKQAGKHIRWWSWMSSVMAGVALLYRRRGGWWQVWWWWWWQVKDKWREWRWQVKWWQVKVRWWWQWQVRWDEMRWGKVKWGDVRWGEVRWDEVTWYEVRWGRLASLQVVPWGSSCLPRETNESHCVLSATHMCLYQLMFL